MNKSAVVLLPRRVNWSRLASPVPGVAPGTKVEQVGDRAQRLVLDLPFGNDRQRLRDVDDRGVGLGRGAGLARAIGAALAGDEDRLGLGQLDAVDWARAECGCEAAAARKGGLHSFMRRD